MDLPDLTPGVPLLQTKLRIPPRRGGQVTRPHLIEQLKAASRQGRTLTLISAPAGSGKTTLLSQWIPRSEQCITWLSLDEEDNDPIRFWTYLIAALQLLKGDLGQNALSLLQSPEPAADAAFLNTLLNEIAAFGDRFSLVLDDYYLIDTPSIHRSLVYLLEHIPPQMQLVISSRIDPPLPLPRLRVRGEMLELRAADLAFTETETANFFAEVMKIALPPEAIAALEARTEGWVAGLQLAGLSIQGSNDPLTFVRSFTGSHRYLLSYLTEEVLDQQPEEVRQFLLETSILDRLSGPLCNAVSRCDDSLSLLEKLEAANLFTRRLDPQGEWFRYHHLFADALRRRLQTEWPARVDELHRRASRWYQDHGLWEPAVEHALDGHDPVVVLRLADSAVEEMFLGGRKATLLRWIEALPAERVCDYPRLCLFHAWTLSTNGNYQDAERCLQSLERSLDEGTAAVAPDDGDEVVGMIAALRACMAGIHGDLSATTAYAEKALHLLPEDADLWRGLAVTYLGTANLLNGQVRAARKAYAEAAPHVRAADNRYELLIINWRRARLFVLEGQLHNAEQLFQQVLEQAEAWGVLQRPVASYALVDLGDLARERNDLDSAEQRLQGAIGRLKEVGSATVLIDGYIALARTRQAMGDAQGATSALQEAEWVAVKHNLSEQFTAPLDGHRARIWLQQDKLLPLRQWAAEMPLQEEHDGAGEIRHLTLARLLIAEDRVKEALHLLEEVRARAEDAGRLARVLETDVLQALAHEREGRRAEALSLLASALSPAEPEGYVRLFADEGGEMAALLRLAGSEGHCPEYVASLLAAIEGVPVETVQPLVDPLSERELEVLALIGEGLTNQAIADRLVISKATAKKHIEHIYRKLDVHSRTEALARAGALGLL